MLLLQLDQNRQNQPGSLTNKYRTLHDAGITGDRALTQDMINRLQAKDAQNRLKGLIPDKNTDAYLQAAGYTKTEAGNIKELVFSTNSEDMSDADIDLLKSALAVLNQVALDREAGRFEDDTQARTDYATSVLQSWDEVKNWAKST